LDTLLDLASLSIDWWMVSRLGLILMLCGELVALTLPFDFPNLTGWLGIPFAALKASRSALITAFVVVILLGRHQLQREIKRLRTELGSDLGRTLRWLAPHVALLSVLIAGTALRVNSSMDLARKELWAALWGIVALGALATWSLALLPARCWKRLFASNGRDVLCGFLAGCVAYGVGRYAQQLWPMLQDSTFSMVALILRLVGGSASVIDAQQSIIGTAAFSVRIAPICSGIEGMVLIACLIGLYLWFYRSEMRFPQAFLLLPIGILAAWLLNAVRIASLILFGSRFPGISAQAFHSLIGWILFNLLTCGLIWGSWRVGLFAQAESPTGLEAAGGHDSASVRLAPLLAMVAMSMIVRAFFPDSSILFPLQVLPAAALLIVYRAKLGELKWKPSVAAIALGGVASALWIALAGTASGPYVHSALGELSSLNLIVWTSFWIIGAVAIVPLVEELAFRDYLRRKLIAWNFDEVALDRFTWISFVGSSLLFGAFRGEWLAGTAVGMIYALAVYRRGNFSDAVLAHATSNGLRCAYALAAGKLFLPH
jgi:exosortase E/protease (VPEID-CTERM system)